jgi:Family of unknown function (DUF5699)
VATLLWIIAVVLVIAGIIQIFQGQIVLGIVLIVLGFLVGPGGVSIFAAAPAGAAGEVLADHRDAGDGGASAAVQVVTLTTLAALAVKVTSVLRYAAAGQIRDVITQLIPWTAGILLFFLAGAAAVAAPLTLWGDVPLGDMDVWSKVLAGLALGSGGSVAFHDAFKAIDQTQSAAEPRLPIRNRHEVVMPTSGDVHVT